MTATPCCCSSTSKDRPATPACVPVSTPGYSRDCLRLAGRGDHPDLDNFRAQAKEGRRVIPVVRRLLVDDLTPVALFRKLAGNRPGTFLLESAENGQTWSRYSFVGARSAAMLTADHAGQVRWVGNTPVGLPTEGRAVDALRDTLAILRTPATGRATAAHGRAGRHGCLRRRASLGAPARR